MNITEISTHWHAAVIAPDAGVGVAMAATPVCECPGCLVRVWQDRECFDAELRVLSMARVDLAPGDGEQEALYALAEVEPQWAEGGMLQAPWSPDALPVAEYGGDVEQLRDHPLVPMLWGRLEALVRDLDREADGATA
ncbi:hypothetical protein I8D64_14015 [Brachybacterium sp. MASK1Z-5]|uniref:Uncharacterized protein n=1 Tax=Brachybacterium halotolerans TaxID=2795215 RepID=A0ABS1BD62_9MICO|nr:hypothetical protein [Brachybacterium halotolerans]MBK0332512.1 hypothetical protein [Brachybacterium halotolerans]